MGRDEAATERQGHYSIELCGGTHVRRTGDIGLFRLVGEGAVAAGVRRIEAVTGPAALAAMETEARLLREAAAALKVSPADLPARIASLMEERRKLERDLAETRKKMATSGAAEAEIIGGLRVSLRDVGEIPAKDLRPLADAILKTGDVDVAALFSTEGGKVSIIIGLSELAKGRADAVALVRAAAAAVGGKGGGGRPEMAQAGGPEADKLPEAMNAVRNTLLAA
jgi:alanyl-tRNA synthetase